TRSYGDWSSDVCSSDLKINTLEWPAQSPDLNPIKHLWEHLKKKLAGYETEPSGILELWDCVEAEWDKIPVEVCVNLINSMPRHRSEERRVGKEGECEVG